MQHGGKRAGAGRKPSNLDLGELERLCGLQCTDEDLAGVFGVNVRTIERRRQRAPAFAAAMERGRAKGRVSVRRLLHVQAFKGDTAALLFLAKNMLGYRDARSNEPGGPNAGPDLPKKKLRFSCSMAELMDMYRKIPYPEDVPGNDGAQTEPRTQPVPCSTPPGSLVVKRRSGEPERTSGGRSSAFSQFRLSKRKIST